MSFREKIDQLYLKHIYAHLTSGDTTHDREIAHERASLMAETYHIPYYFNRYIAQRMAEIGATSLGQVRGLRV